MTGHLKVGGSWQQIAGISTKIDGTWTEVSNGYTKVDGAWQEFYSSAPAAAPSFDLLATEILASSQASVTFDVSSYAGVYQHLQIRAVAKSTYDGNTGSLYMRFNGDAGNNYSSHTMFAGGGSASVFSTFDNTTFINAGYTAGFYAGTGVLGPMVADFLDCFKTTKHKGVRILGGIEGSTDYIQLNSGSWRNTSALSSITIGALYGGSLANPSRFSLYGLKAE